MVPAFGEFASGIECVGGCGFPGPGDWEGGGGGRVERGVEGAELGGGEREVLEELARAEAEVDGDTIVVELVNEGHQIPLRGLGDVAVADDGDFAEGSVEEVGGDVVDGPAGDNGGATPVFGRKAGQEFEQEGFDFGENRGHARF